MSLKLTREQRRRFFSRDKRDPWPELGGEGVPPVQVGYVHTLSTRLSFQVTKVNRRRGRWSLEYRIIDDREEAFYLIPAARSLPIDERGNVTPMAPEEEIGYTRDPRRARADYMRSVPPNLQNVYSMQAKLTRAEMPASEAELRSQERSFRGRLHAALNTLTPAAKTALLTRLEHDLAEATKEEQQAA